MSIKVKTGGQQIRALIESGTFNREARTVDVVFATDTPVLTGYWDKFYEILSFEGSAVRMDRLNAGAPMLDRHNKYSAAADQPGVVERAWIKDGKGYATLRFANDKSTIQGVPDGPGERLMNRVAEGIVKGVSVGYNVFQYEEADSVATQSMGMADDNSIPTYRAIDWEPFEISFESIPADIKAGVRSMQERQDEKIPSYEVEVTTINNNNQNNMKYGNRMQRDNGAGSGAGGGTAPATQNQGGGATATQQSAAPEGGEGTRSAAQQPAPPAPAAPATAAPNTDGARASSILERCEAAGLGIQFARGLIDGGLSIERCFSAIIDEYARGDKQPTQQGNSRAAVTGDLTRENRRDGIQNALEHRLNPAAKLTDLGREYRGMGLIDMAREMVEGIGGNTRGLYKADIAKLSLNIGDDSVRASAYRSGGGMMSTSDFPIILGNTINRMLRAEYDVQERTFLPFSRRTVATDFRPMTMVQLGEISSFQEVKEGAEYRRTATGEAKESYSVKKYGEIIPITWEAIVNDDLGAFTRLLPKIAAAAARTQSDLIYAMLLGNPTMGDGVTLFHANHKNVATAAAIGIDSFGLARLLMRQQMGIQGKDYLNLTPGYILTGPTNEQLVMQYTSNDYTPTTATTQNVWKGLVTPIIEPRITDNSWYFIAKPNQIDTIEYAFLEGDGELFTEQRTGFDVDGLEIKARMVFGSKVIDWRGFVKNAGA